MLALQSMLPRINPLLFLLIVSTAAAQDLPREIRGYKVHREPVFVKTAAAESSKNEVSGAVLRTGEPVISDISITGITFEIPVDIISREQSGKIDFLTFHDFRVNGLAVDVEEYDAPFSFRKNELFNLPKPARIFLLSTQILKAAWKEMNDSKNEWTITGRVFAYGKFRKYGLYHKRVVPIEINIRIKNPLHETH